MKTIFLLSHSTGKHAGVESLEEYLLRQGYAVNKLLHPLDDYSLFATSFSINSNVVYTKTRRNKGMFNYLEDVIFSIRQIRKSKVDTFIGASNFDTLPAIICKNLLRQKIPHIMYYPRDFAEDRFSSKLLNFLYDIVEKAAIKFSDVVVSNTFRAENKRREYGLDLHKSIIIPNGVYLQNPIFRKKKILQDHFVYVGNVTREHGLYNLILTLKPIIKHITIIGAGGNDFDRTINMCNEENIPFELHSKKNHQFVLNYLKGFNGFGLAPYNLDSKWTYYCSPLKVNEYIANGVPVLISSLPEIADLVKKEGLGIVYDGDSEKSTLENKLKNFDSTFFHQKAKKFYQEFNYDKLYERIGL